MKKTIVGIGEILWDIFPDRKALGGAPANFAYHCMQLGHEAYAISAIGKDPLGEEVKRELASKGLQHILQEVSYPTGKVLVTLAETGSGSYDIQEDVAWDHISFTQELEQLAHRTDAVVLWVTCPEIRGDRQHHTQLPRSDVSREHQGL